MGAVCRYKVSVGVYSVWFARSAFDVSSLHAFGPSFLKARISAPPPVAGLPEGITQRDDVYTKTEAFLTHVPNLD